METITVSAVAAEKPTGWNDYELEDGRTVSTKDKAQQEALFQSIGTPIEVELRETTKGGYTNIYVNRVEGVTPSDRPARSSNNGGSRSANNNGGGKDSARIAAQWAIGRAVELKCSDASVEYENIEETAIELLELSKKLAKKAA